MSFCAFRGVPFCSLWLFEPSGGYPSQLRASDRGPSHKLPKTVRCPKVPYKEFISAVAGLIFKILAFWALIFFILALWAFISFHFGFLGLHFSFWASILAFGAFILAFWALRKVSFGFILAFGPPFWPLGLSFWPFEPCGRYPLVLCGLLGLQRGYPLQLLLFGFSLWPFGARAFPQQVAKRQARTVASCMGFVTTRSPSIHPPLPWCSSAPGVQEKARKEFTGHAVPGVPDTPLESYTS